MFNKFLAAIFVPTFGMSVFACVSFAATAMVHDGLSEEFSEDKCIKSSVSEVAPLIKLPRNVGSADLTSLPPPKVPLARDSSHGWGNYCDEPSSPRARINSKESGQEYFFEEILSALKGQQGGVVLLSLGSPSQFARKKLLSSVEDEEKESAGFPSQLVYRGAIITFSLMGTS